MCERTVGVALKFIERSIDGISLIRRQRPRGSRAAVGAAVGCSAVQLVRALIFIVCRCSRVGGTPIETHYCDKYLVSIIVIINCAIAGINRDARSGQVELVCRHVVRRRSSRVRR